jgi:chitinase
MALTAEGRTKFTESCVEMVLRHNFDGLDLDWEYPGGREDSPGNWIFKIVFIYKCL